MYLVCFKLDLNIGLRGHVLLSILT